MASEMSFVYDSLKNHGVKPCCKPSSRCFVSVDYDVAFQAEAVVSGQISDAFKRHKEDRAAAAAAAAAAETTAAAAVATAQGAGEATAQGAGEAGGAAPAVSTARAAPSELKFAAVVDPPRSGVHAKCLRSIRSTKAIKRLVREMYRTMFILGEDGARRGSRWSSARNTFERFALGRNERVKIIALEFIRFCQRSRST